MMKIWPSIASCDQHFLSDELSFAKDVFGRIHLDIEDGKYLWHFTYDKDQVEELLKHFDMDCSVHLMVEDPLDYLDVLAFYPCVKIVFMHLEHLANPDKVIQAYRKRGLTVGLGLSDRNLKAALSPVVLGSVDAYLMLTAAIDDLQQVFSEALLDFAHKLSKAYQKELWLDGGIKVEMLESLVNKGIENAILGRAVFSQKQFWKKGGTP
ncbi:MAG: hypothetical protein LBR25_00030 [Erysipelotrichaceae bacterium]|jgi:pentose-5-phosphate-3-epimerase|nr:hypothetical protein [Erysipelotrichaceae bacterium]